MNTVNEIAHRLVSLVEDSKFVEAYQQLFSEHAESIDPLLKNVPLKGLASLVEREQQFLADTDIHDVKVSEPLFAGSYFSVIISLEFTRNGQDRTEMEELGVYKVENGKIVSQQFFIG